MITKQEINFGIHITSNRIKSGEHINNNYAVTFPFHRYFCQNTNTSQNLLSEIAIELVNSLLQFIF